MTTRLPRLLALLAVAGMAGCASSGSGNADTQISYDEDTDFSAYRTYDWVDRETRGQPSATGLDEQMESQIVSAVDQALAAKGMRRSSTDPDFRVVWYGAFQGRLEEEEIKERYPSYFQREREHTYTRTEIVTTRWEDGTFVLDMLDGDTDEVTWSLNAQGAIERSGNPEVMQERFNEAATRLLADFPPR